MCISMCISISISIFMSSSKIPVGFIKRFQPP